MTISLSPFDPRGTVLSEEVYRRIADAILAGELAPGEKLRDQELAERLGVSRTPVREALQRLEAVGMVQVIPGRYTHVSYVEPKDQRDTTEFVVYLLGNAVRMAVPRCSDDELAQLVDAAGVMAEASRADDPAQFSQATLAFFEKLVPATDNIAMAVLMREGAAMFRFNIGQWNTALECPIGRTAMVEDFRDALASRDAALAESLLRQIQGLE